MKKRRTSTGTPPRRPSSAGARPASPSRRPASSTRPRAIALVAGQATWRDHGAAMLELERAEWGSRAFSREEMRRQMTSATSVIAVTLDGARLVGFAVATPGWSARAATLNNVLLAPERRGQGLVWPLVGVVEDGLRERGYRSLVIDARVENGFADSVERHYRGRARVLERDHPSEYGPQRTIAVDIIAS